ncbi:autotransporter adhesin [Mesorhizobium robiniae]|uniref:Autotransporter adhesin n=1 Tax=Mesorhizobium robiniae TaxID=559315 RepID=A0ABV2GSB5_9HYPH
MRFERSRHGPARTATIAGLWLVAGVSWFASLEDAAAQSTCLMGGGATAAASGSDSFACGDAAAAVGGASTSIGESAGSATSGEANTAVGNYAGFTVTGSFNAATGAGAGLSVTGDDNSAFGATAGRYFTGSGNVAIGRNAGSGEDGAPLSMSNSVSIGANAAAGHDNAIAIGSGVTTERANQVSLGTATNTYTLAGINSQASRDAQGATAYFMTTDGNGNLAASTFDVATLEGVPGQVTQNSTHITNLSTTVDSHATQINAHTTELADHETRITSNTSTLNAHTTQIANLDTRVTTNTDDITQLDGRVGALEANFQDIGGRINETRSEARAGTALALATAGLRYDDRSEKLSIAGGFGHFKGQSGLALGLGYNTSEDFRLNAAVSASTNRGDVGVSVGASWTLN